MPVTPLPLASEEPVEAVAARLLGHAPLRVERAGGGGNSRLYKVFSPQGEFALKMYPDPAHDPRPRLETEAQALRFFAECGVVSVPKLYQAGQGCALLEWIDGGAVDTPAAQEIDEAAGFLAAMQRISAQPGAERFAPASEACLSGAEILRQLDARLQKLSRLDDPVLRNFLHAAFMPRRAHAEVRAKALYPAFATPLPRAQQSLIPSDFGFHNAMRTRQGLKFIDFEYFGWDDPVKVTADFLLHPATALPPALQEHFRNRLLALHERDAYFAARLSALTPLFALRWTLILLNEFLPERWNGRAFARGETRWQDVKDRQLAKARSMLEKSAAE